MFRLHIYVCAVIFSQSQRAIHIYYVTYEYELSGKRVMWDSGGMVEIMFKRYFSNLLRFSQFVLRQILPKHPLFTTKVSGISPTNSLNFRIPLIKRYSNYVYIDIEKSPANN